MSLSLSVESPSGHKAELRVALASDGTYVVKAGAHVTPKLLSPFLVIATFASEATAERYAKGIRDAIEGAE